MVVRLSAAELWYDQGINYGCDVYTYLVPYDHYPYQLERHLDQIGVGTHLGVLSIIVKSTQSGTLR